jgi:hypothetical protein
LKPGTCDGLCGKAVTRHLVAEAVPCPKSTASAGRAKQNSDSHEISVLHERLKFGFTKVRYRGLEKNANWLVATCGLTNLYILRHRFQTAQHNCTQRTEKSASQKKFCAQTNTKTPRQTLS